MDGSIGTPPVMRSREFASGTLNMNELSTREMSAINSHDQTITNSTGGIRKRIVSQNKDRKASQLSNNLSSNIRATNRLYNFNKVDLRNSRLTQNKKFIRETFLAGTFRSKRTKKEMNEIQ